MVNQAPADEQMICVKCGMCCDGTLFMHARLNKGERGNLPEKIEENSYAEDEKEYFRLPCQYFSGKCSIYDKKRAEVCGSYRCQLLKNFSVKKVTLEEAIEMVGDALRMRDEIMEHYRKITGREGGLSFRQLLAELGKSPETDTDTMTSARELALLQIRCNILEALLIKHIRSATDFENIVEA